MYGPSRSMPTVTCYFLWSEYEVQVCVCVCWIEVDPSGLQSSPTRSLGTSCVCLSVLSFSTSLTKQFPPHLLDHIMLVSASFFLSSFTLPHCLCIALSVLCMMTPSLHITPYWTPKHTQTAECVLSYVHFSSHSLNPISNSPLPLTHFYYCGRSLSLMLCCLLPSLSVSVFMNRAILRMSGWHRHRGGERVSRG